MNDVRVRTTPNAQALIRHYEPAAGIEMSEPLSRFLFGADPFVISLAFLRGATIVTNEKAGGSPTKPKIPTVAAGWNVPTVDFFGLMRLENQTF